MDKNKLDLLIQEAAQLQKQELSWVGNLFRQRLKDLQENTERYQEWQKTCEAKAADQSDPA